MRYLKLACVAACLAVFTSNLWSMSRWSERRGVSDDLCYLRQAHLFQQFGLRGITTDIATDTDGYFKRLVTEAGHPEWNAPDASICHTRIAVSGKLVLQYPPGPGFLLAAFPEGHQVVPLYVTAKLLLLAMALLAISLAKSRAAALGAAAFGAMALYFMINPAKASYSIAPTMVLCAAIGFLTAQLFRRRTPDVQFALTALIGLLLGGAVNFRIPNLLLSAGYGMFFLICFAAARNARTFLQGASFGIGFLIGLAPTLIANAINAGSPLATTYGPGDTVAPDFTFGVVGNYARDLQGILIAAAIAWVIALFIRHRTPALLPVALITAINLAVNLVYFLSHPIFTPYYLMPPAMLSLWGLLFAYLLDDRERAAPSC